MNVYQRYLAKKNEVRKAKEELEEIEGELYTMHLDKIKKKEEEGGTVTVNDQGYKFKCALKFTYRIESKDGAEKLLQEGVKAFKHEIKFDKKAFTNLDIDQQEKVLSVMSVKSAKPSFSVEAKDEE